VDLSIKKLPPKPLIALVASLVVTVICNLLLFKAISLISVGKSTLIFSTNPMFAMMLASCLLSEQIQKIVIGSTIGAFVGIYFLTQNKENVKGHEENLVLGVLCVFLGAWFQALIFVLVRMISVHNINFMIRPFYAG
jgi:drug/metabolite transporter (DMT)-like permease